MTRGPEIEKPVQQPEVSEDVVERQEQMVVPESAQQIGAKPTQTQAGAVSDDDGQVLVQPVPKATVAIKIPKSQTSLQSMSSGSQDDSSTWFGTFWVRMIKIALHNGWQVVSGGSK